MRGFRVMAVLAVSMVTATQAWAASPEVCKEFADYAMRSQQIYYSRGCPRVPQMNNGGAQGAMGHYNWCAARPLPVVQADRRKKEQLMNSCMSGQTVGGPQPRPVPNTGPDRAFCEAYGREMTGLWAQAKAKGCRAYQTRQNHVDIHFGWCMRQPRAVAQRGLEGNRRSVATCR